MSFVFRIPRLMLYVVLVVLVSCEGNPPDLGELSGKETVYLFEGESIFAATGSVLFQEKKDGSLLATIKLKNTTEGAFHAAVIYFGSTDDPGGVALTLEPVAGSTGESSTQFSALADATPINFDELLIFDGHIIIHQDDSGNGPALASTDIGQNSANNANIN